MKLPPRSRRTHIKKCVAALHYDFRNFALEHFIDYLNANRQRPIRLTPFPTHLNIGMWARGQRIDYALFAQNAHIHPVLQEHIALHEIAHILLDHPTKTVDELTETERAHVAHLPATAFTGVLMRLHDSPLDTPIEIEAEYMATLVKQRIIDARHRYTWNGQLSSINGMDAIAENLQFFDDKLEH